MKTEVTVLNFLAKGCGWRDEWIELERVWRERLVDRVRRGLAGEMSG
jgi:hypothetical protein